MTETSREQRLEAILHSYLQAVDAGQQPDLDDIVRQHAEFADEIRAFFVDQQKLAQFAQSMHKVPVGEPTLDVDEMTTQEIALQRVRYFGDYELEEEIARGGMGIVFKAKQVSLNRTVALKMILQGELASHAEVLRFRTEATAAGNLDHPNIVPIYEVGEHEGQQYFSMKLIGPGKRGAELGMRETVRVMSLVARAVHHAHQRGILHRDLKPSNILFDEKGDPHVADFGLAKHVGTDSGMTRSGAIVGTPSYMAPEQARAEKVLTTAVDVYSLGAILYEWLTEQPPFLGPHGLATPAMVANDDPPRPRSVNPGIDRDLETICLKCLNKDVNRRYGSAQALAEDLERWQRGEPIEARPAGRTERLRKWVRRKPAQAAVLAVSVVATLALLTGGLWFTRELRVERDNVQRNLSNSYILLAENSWNHAGTAELSRDYLEKIPQAFRNWEWAYLHRKYQGSLFTIYEKDVTMFNGEKDVPIVNDVAWSGDGSRLATASNGGSVKIWDARTGQLVLEFDRQKAHVNRLAWNSDSSRLAGALQTSHSPVVRIWDAKTGQVLLEFTKHEEGVTALAWSPDGRRIASASVDRTIHVWDTANGKPLFALKDGGVHVAWSPDGSRLAGDGLWFRIYNADTGEILRTIPVANTGSINGLSFGPEGNRLAAALQDGRALVWDVGTGTLLLELKGHTGWATSVAWSPDGTRLASSSYDETVRVWDARTGATLIEHKGHRSEVLTVCWSPDGRRLASASWDRTVRVWDAQSDEALLPLPGFSVHDKSSVAWNNDGTRYAIASPDKMVSVWKVQSDQPLFELKASDPNRGLVGGHKHGVNCMAWSPDGNRLACAGGEPHPGKGEGELRTWDAATGKALCEFKGHTKFVHTVAWSPDGSRLASASDDVTGLFSLRENAIAKEPGSGYAEYWRCVSRLGL